jgi:hypothetical protein
VKIEYRELLRHKFLALLVVTLPVIVFVGLRFDTPRVPTIGGYAYSGNLNFLLQVSFLYLCFAVPLISKLFSRSKSCIHLDNPRNENEITFLNRFNIGIFLILFVQTAYSFCYRYFYLNDFNIWVNANQRKVLLLLLIATFFIFRNKLISIKTAQNLFPVLNLFFFALALSLKNTNLEFNINRYIFLLSAFGILVLGICLTDRLQRLKYLALEYLVVLPIISFMTFSSVSTNYSLHPYESMSYSNFNLLIGGQLPWKNFELEHGVWTDLFRNLLSSSIAGDQSFWAQSYTYGLIVRPIEVFIFLIGLRLLTRSIMKTIVIFICLKMVESLFGLGFWSFPQITPVIFITYFLFIFFKRGNTKSLIFLGFCLGLSILWAPESIYSLVAVTCIIALFRESGLLGLLKQLMVLCFTIFLTIFCILQPFLLFLPFLKSNLAIANGYNFAWADKIHFEFGLVFSLLVISLPIALILMLSNLLKSDKVSLSPIKKALGVPVIVTVFFYWKFLQWPDWHILSPATLLILTIALALILPRRNLFSNHSLAQNTILLILFAPMIYLPSPLFSNSHSSTEISLSREANRGYLDRIYRMKETFSPFLNQKTQVFDFGNEPLTWFGHFKYESAASINKVLNINSFKTERMIVEELNSNPSLAIVWGSEFGYSDYPFGPTFVRKPLIAAHILEKYSPVSIDGSYILFMPKGQFPVNETAIESLKKQDCSLRFNLNIVSYGKVGLEEAASSKKFVPLGNPSFENSEIILSSGHRIFLKTNELQQNLFLNMSYCPSWVYSPEGSKWALVKTKASQ